MQRRFQPGVLALAIATLCSSAAAAPTPNAKAAPACAALAGMNIPASRIDLPTRGATVDAAVPTVDVDTAGAARDYCKVTGVIHPVDPNAAPIRFQVNLPARWNQRALQMGGGGTDGTVVTGLGSYVGQPASQPTALAQGFVTLGSDSGHNADSDPPFDTHFALNQEQLLNFGQLQVKKTLDTAQAIIKTYYRKKPRYVYFAGGSQGGHEAFDAAQRYPKDYDGVIAQYPAYNIINMHLGSQAQAQAVYGHQSGVASPSWLNPAKVATLVKAVAGTCDKLDGVEDGIIGNVQACNKAFTIETVKASLRCPDGRDTGDGCLSDAQIGTVAKIASPVQFNFAFASGASSYPRWPILEGATFLNNHLGRTNTAQNPPVVPFDPVNGSAFQLLPASGTIKGIITRDFATDPLAFDADTWVPRIRQVSDWMEATSTDLDAFRRRGGKMLMTHGTIDDSITPHNTIAYYRKLVAANGQAKVDDFVRFYLIPGFGHGDGIFRARWDSLGALQAWVEHGRAPRDLVASDGNVGTPGAGRTRPLCAYPAYPQYQGRGNVNAASSFKCAQP